MMYLRRKRKGQCWNLDDVSRELLQAVYLGMYLGSYYQVNEVGGIRTPKD